RLVDHGSDQEGVAERGVRLAAMRLDARDECRGFRGPTGGGGRRRNDLAGDFTVVVERDVRVADRVPIFASEIAEDAEGVQHGAEGRIDLVGDARRETTERRESI